MKNNKNKIPKNPIANIADGPKPSSEEILLNKNTKVIIPKITVIEINIFFIYKFLILFFDSNGSFKFLIIK
jgi:hypothetical protein